jgi:RNA polymerase subunit RPABC4/transcription elongation factor Spt4
LNEITNKNIVKLQALTNFRIFEYEFEMHEGHYLLTSDIEDIILTNKRWVSHKNNDKGCIETTIVGDLTFINQGKQCITFSEINDPDSLTRLLKAARDHILLVRGNTNGMSSKVIICTQCGNANSRKSRACNQCGSKLLFIYSKCGHINPEGANFCNICGSPLDGMPFADP